MLGEKSRSASSHSSFERSPYQEYDSRSHSFASRISSIFRPTSITWWVLATCAALTLLIEAPLIAFPLYAGDSYHGINIAHFGNDEHHYLTRGKEILEGHRLGQMYLSVWKDKEDSFQSNAEQILLFPFTLFSLGASLNVVTLYNILNAIGVFVMLILMYLFAYLLSKDRLVALACAIFAVGGYVLIENGTILYSFLKTGHLFYDNFNIYGRSAFPYMALIPFFGFLICTYRALSRNYAWPLEKKVRTYIDILAAGALLGLLFYVYFYAWTYALAFLGVVTLCSLLTRRWSAAGAAVAIGTIGVLIGSWKLWGYYALFSSPLGEQFSYFFMTEHSRTFITSSTGLVMVTLFVLYFFFRRSDSNNYILFSLIATGWIALEQQMITGRTVQYGHYYWYFVVPLSIIVAVYIVTHLVPERWKRFVPVLCIAIVFVAFVNTIGGQYRSFFTTVPGKMREQDFAPIIEKLHALPQGVVLADPGGSSLPFLVTIYTNDDLYWLPAASTSAFPKDYPKYAFFSYLYLNSESRENPERYLKVVLASSTPNAYVYMYELLEGIEYGIPRKLYEKTPFPHTQEPVASIRDAYISTLADEYKGFAASRASVVESLKKANVKYILWDAQQYPEWDVEALGRLDVLATSTDLTLYSFSTTQ